MVDFKDDSEFYPLIGYEDLYKINAKGQIKSNRYFNRVRINDYDLSGYPYMLFTKDKKTKGLRIHRLVAKMFVPNPRNLNVVDHIDGNPKNNHYTNLRWVTVKENSHNSKKRVGNNRYKGVSTFKHTKTFRAYASVDGKQIHIGTYKTDKEAAKAYNKYIYKLRGEHAKLNVINESNQP